MLRLPSQIIKQTPDEIEVLVLKEIETLNNFLPSTKAIKACKNKDINWEYQAKIWERYKRQWAKALTVFPQIEAKERIVDTTIISKRVRLIDLENLYGGSKPIRDTLQRRGWLYDDAPKWGGLQVIQEKVSKNETGTIIRLRKRDEENVI
jgi:hypothetical protein